MTKNALLIPGKGEQILTGYAGNPHQYKPLMNALKGKGFTVYDIHIDWDGAYGDWVKEATTQIDELDVDPNQTSLIGFSWGALTALGVSQKYAPHVLGLASLSPHGGKGSVDRIRQDAIRRGYEPSPYTPEQTAAFEALDVGSMALGNLATETIIAYGSLETDILKERCVEVAGLTPGVVEAEVQGVCHAINEPDYARMLANLTAESFLTRHA
jgi:pimeloyl-ACP methyl ester carboxylesterase